MFQNRLSHNTSEVFPTGGYPMRVCFIVYHIMAHKKDVLQTVIPQEVITRQVRTKLFHFEKVSSTKVQVILQVVILLSDPTCRLCTNLEVRRR